MDQRTDTEDFEALRPLLLSIAYRMLGSVADAEDIVQESFIRYQAIAPETVTAPRRLLTTITTRLAIDHLRSARRRREAYVGAWLPEPVIDEGAVDPASRAELADSISMAFLLLLERLNPIERAVYLLREVFAFDFEEIATVVDRNAQNCRQIASRARSHLEEHRPRFDASMTERRALVERFLVAAESGDLETLTDALAADVVLYADGGGNAPALSAPVHGRERVARILLGLARAFSPTGLRAQPTTVNGQPGAIMVSPDGRIVSVMALDVLDGQIHVVRSLVNPDKLRHLGEVADIRALLAGRRHHGAPSR